MRLSNRRRSLFSTGILAITLLTSVATQAQTFDSGSDGSDGALNLTTPGTVYFFGLPGLDSDGDRVYHFTTINIASGVTVDFTKTISGPVIWLATGDVEIDGDIVLDGEAGHGPNGPFRDSLPGAGGFSGGQGRSNIVFAKSGKGPGGGIVQVDCPGSGAGFLVEGEDGGNYFGGTTAESIGGKSYGNAFLLPLIGGSGGSGGGGTFASCPSASLPSTGGGAGGGALLIASSTDITVNGTISADGGDSPDPNPAGGSGFQANQGGGGSGGAIRIIAPTITGNGTLRALGGLPLREDSGNIVAGSGSPGRTRLEAFQIASTINIASPAEYSTPGPVFLPQDQLPIRVASIGGVPVPANPTGGFVNPDVEINQSGPTTINIEGNGVPLGTVVTLTLIPETGETITADSTPLTGTVENSTASADVVIPFGISRFYVEATVTP